MTSTNVDLMRQAYELWNTGGIDAMVEQFWAPDIVWYDIPEAIDTGVWRGADEVAARLRTIMEAIGHFQVELHSLEESGDYALAEVALRLKGSSSGVAIATPQFQIARLADGRLREWWTYQDGDQARQVFERLSAQHN